MRKVKKSVEDVEVNGRTVLVRVDLNVPMREGRVEDDTRIRAVLPTLRYLLEKGARAVILATHLGRPKGKVVEALRLDPVARRLEQLLQRPVKKLDEVVGDRVAAAIAGASPGTVLMLENVRFEAGEEKNDAGFARQLAAMADLYVNDAFGTAHRAHASTAGVAAHLPAVAGLLMQKEIQHLSRCLEEPGRPLVVILGGAKVSDKMGIIGRFLELADTLLIGGGMANTFLAARGADLGDSLVEIDKLEQARAFLEKSTTGHCRLFLPVDLVITEKLEQGAPLRETGTGDIPAGWKAVDIGPKTVEEYSRHIQNAGMIIWNGPMGVFEVPPFDRGTAGIARAVAESDAFSVVGGGDVVAALEQLGLAGRISFISTGGGATLEFWEGRELPGLAVLQDKS